MKLQNGIIVNIHKSFYNKSVIQEDGVTHMIDTEHEYPLYILDITKNYYNIEDRDNVIDNIIDDLKSTIQELQQLKEQSTEKER